MVYLLQNKKLNNNHHLQSKKKGKHYKKICNISPLHTTRTVARWAILEGMEINGVE